MANFFRVQKILCAALNVGDYLLQSFLVVADVRDDHPKFERFIEAEGFRI